MANDLLPCRDAWRGGPIAEGRNRSEAHHHRSVLSIFGIDGVEARNEPPEWVSRLYRHGCVLGRCLIVVGLTLAMWSIVQNGYAAATVMVEGWTHKPASTGLDKLGRHPMYAANLILMVGMPMAWAHRGMVGLVPGILVLVFRIPRTRRSCLTRNWAETAKTGQTVR